MTGACWSTAICTESERRALGLASDGEWLLTCRLSDGHNGDHATDASMRPRQDRRTWLTWNDRAIHQLLDREPCPMRSLAGTPCLLFTAHGGMHYYGAPVQAGNPAQPAGSIDSPDVRMPNGRAERNHHNNNRVQTSIPAKAIPTHSVPAHAAVDPFEADPAPRASRTLDAHQQVTADPTAELKVAQQVDAKPLDPVAQPAAQPAAAPAASNAAASDAAASDAVATALSDLASAIDRLAEAVRRHNA